MDGTLMHQLRWQIAMDTFPSSLCRYLTFERAMNGGYIARDKKGDSFAQVTTQKRNKINTHMCPHKNSCRDFLLAVNPKKTNIYDTRDDSLASV